MKKVLPQANDLDKVIDVMTYIYYHPGATHKEIAGYIGFTYRQSQYYIGACIYLNLVDKLRYPTPKCCQIFKDFEINEGVYEQIITDELMGHVFAHALLYPNSDLDSFSQNLVSLAYPEINSDVTLERRAHCIVLWVKKIICYIIAKKNNN